MIKNTKVVIQNESAKSYEKLIADVVLWYVNEHVKTEKLQLGTTTMSRFKLKFFFT